MRLLSAAVLGVMLVLAPICPAKTRAARHQARPTVRHSINPLQGIATWYGWNFSGRRMANGQRLDNNTFVAASPTLPFGTKVKVTNQRTGLSTIVEITDRGPWTRSRILDLAFAPAKAINCLSVCKVTVDVLPATM